jgi:prephenate dehydratase
MKIGIFCLKVCYMNAKIAIQGIKGPFHQVAQEYYESVVVDECLSLKNW